MKKTLLLTIAALITAWSAMAAQPLPGKDWNPVSGPVTYSATDFINIHITGTGDNQYDRLELSSGTLTPGGATLNVFPCYTPIPGDRFVIFKAPTIDGVFSKPPLIDAGGNSFVLSYEEDGPDKIVVLVAVAKLFGLNISTSGSATTKPDYNYMLTVVANPEIGGIVVPTQATYQVCNEIPIEAIANPAYIFSGWTQEGGAIITDAESPNTMATMPARNVKLTANFECRPPTALTATDITTNTFTANWEEVPGAVTYTLEVSRNENFTGDLFETKNLEAGTSSQTVTVVVDWDCGTQNYYYRVKAIYDVCGESAFSGTVTVTITVTIADIDGNMYNTVLIGGQCWMKENLKTTHYRNGMPIDYPGADNTAWQNNTTGAYSWNDNDIGWKDKYGALYNWYAVNNTNGLCPIGWHAPSDDEWTQLVNYVESQGYPNESFKPEGAGNALKSCRQVDSPLNGYCNTTEHPRWNSHHIHHGFDAFGFSGLPGGSRYQNGVFHYFGAYGFWWSSTEATQTHALRSSLVRSGSEITQSTQAKHIGLSVRCLKDE